MYKLFGLILVFMAFCAIGFIACGRIKRQIRQRNAILELLSFIRINILHGETPLYEIFKSFKNKELEECGFLQLLCQKDDDSFFNALEQCEALKIGEADKQNLIMFASRLGKTCFAESEISLCDKYLAIMDDEFKKKNKVSEQKADLLLKLCPLCGLFVAVLLI